MNCWRRGLIGEFCLLFCSGGSSADAGAPISTREATNVSRAMSEIAFMEEKYGELMALPSTNNTQSIVAILYSILVEKVTCYLE